MKFDAVQAKEAQKEPPKRNRAMRKRYNKLSDRMVVKGLTSDGYPKIEYGGQKGVFDIVRVRKFDIWMLDDDEFANITDNYWYYMKEYPYPVKEVFMNFPEDNKEQQEYYIHKIKASTNAVQTKLLHMELEKLRAIESDYRKRDTYYFLFAPNARELDKRIGMLQDKYKTLLDIQRQSLDMKARIMATMVNSDAPHRSVESEIDFLEMIQPQGNISFKDEFYIRKGNEYQACLHVYGYPNLYLGFWMDSLTNYENTIATIDYMTDTDKDFKEILKKTTTEYRSRRDNSTNQTTYDINHEEFEASRDLALKVNGSGETIKLCHTRIFISAITVSDLEKQTEEIRKAIRSEGFESMIFLDENEEEWLSMFMGYDLQEKLPSFHKGNEIPAEAMGLGFAHNQTSLKDPTASYWGYTRTYGTVYWDLFHKSDLRLYYNVFVCGDMGSGKSTALKKMLADNGMKGNYIRGFDKAGEFVGVVADQGGQTIQLNGESGILNLFQVYPNATKQLADKTIVIDEEASFAQHVKKLKMTYQLKQKDATESELDVISEMVYHFYRAQGLWGGGQQMITQHAEERYPILEQWVVFLKQEAEQEVEEDLRAIKRKLHRSFDSMLRTYGNIFNGYSTIKDFTNEKIIFYATGGLESLDEYVFDIQIYNATTQIWATMTQVGREEMNAYYSGKKHWFDLTRFLVLMDECHNYLNIEKAFTAKFFVTMLSEARKFLAGVVFATQRLERMFPKADNVQSEEMVLAANQLSQIVGLCQYKMIFRQDISSMDLLRRVFQNQLTQSEYAAIPNFKGKGDCILSIAGDQNLNMHIQITDEEEALYAGGV
ncbi:TraE, Type IV secretion system protein [Listeria booriae]|uniref:TraE, Type IV secretion system protein n=2 Tax=Listeria booriae TaxID=1552123 RepID=A0A841YTJ4_9LIST|nr:TraE, Type IV secretion system protein [Listeria booriae]MBC1403118.1 TraE, Type IV secretion system protein [Listeria booriae]MBC1617926.1 TraE, Type IV secretion system protein [Listeria booriae]